MARGVNTIFTLTLAGESGKREAMIKELQRDPVSEDVLHVDFIRLDLERRLTVSVPVRLVSTPTGVKNEGGVLDFMVINTGVYAINKEDVDILAVLSEEFGLVGVLVLFAVYLYIVGRCLYIAALARSTYARLLAGSLGLTFFVYGLNIGLFPIGQSMAYAFARKGSLLGLLSFAFALGFGTTIAEPALIAVAAEAAEVAAIREQLAQLDQDRGKRRRERVEGGGERKRRRLRFIGSWSRERTFSQGF